ncbi:MAG TPA: hypothetical protein PK283_04590, partial [Thiotrichales bacterium]|nr:hypothetical protein [Thiotrichales bacterium]
MMQLSGIRVNQLAKVWLICTGLWMSAQAMAQEAVRVEITGGTEQALPIAVTPFKNQMSIVNPDYNIAQIIRDD